jgi:hypothetical protein
MTDTELKRATPEHLAKVADYASPLVGYITRLPVGTAMEVVMYIMISCFMELETIDGVSKLEAFDHYAAAIRTNIEKNLELQQTKAVQP